MGAFSKNLAKQLLKSRNAQELNSISLAPEEHLNSAVHKMNYKKSSMIDVLKKLKNAIKLDIVELNKPETYPEDKVLPEDGLYRYLYQPCEQHGYKKDELLNLFGVRIHINKTKLQEK